MTAKAITIYEAIKKFKWPKPSSKVVGIEILLGEGCNAKCIFCCAEKELGRWLSYSKVIKLLDKARQKGSWYVSFSGGEATLYPDILKVVKYAKENNFKLIQIISNGIKLADLRFASKLVEAGANEFKISLHSTTKKIHDYLVGVKGAFVKVQKAFDNLNTLKVKVSSNFAINKLNYKELPLFTKLMVERYGLTGFCFMFSFYSGKMLSSDLDIRYSEVIPYLKCSLEYIRQNNVPIETKMLNNFLPCLMPEYVNIMSDWGEEEDYSTTSKDGRVKENKNFYKGRKKLLKKCKKCIFYEKCFGVDKFYLEKFGEDEFIPVVKEIPQRLPDPLYR